MNIKRRTIHHNYFTLLIKNIPGLKLFIFIFLFGTLTACQSKFLTPPRIAQETISVTSNTPEVSEPLYLPAPTATSDPNTRDTFEPLEKTTLNVWVNETSAEHEDILRKMMDEFTQENGIDIALQLVGPKLLPNLMHTAVLSDTLPDIVLHPLEYSAAWSAEGLLDPNAADAIIDQIGRESFNQDALNLVAIDGKTVAIPSDGFQQIWLYRSDWVEENGLDVPENFPAMLEVAEKLYDQENIISGLVIPTESNLITTHRAFEHLAIANGCRLIDAAGEVQLLDSTCREALDFYFSIVNQYSPPGVQTDTSARNAYLDGRTAMIMTSPSILPELYVTNRLDLQTGIVTSITGEGPDAAPANFGNITYLGITPKANEEAAAAFAEYWFNEGYPLWLNVESERKVPMRLGTAAEPTKFIEDWGNTPVIDNESLVEIYGVDIVAQLRDGLADTNRWGFKDGHGALAGQLYENLTFSVVLQEMLSGYFNSQETIFEAANRVIELIPDYQFAIEPTPTPPAEE